MKLAVSTYSLSRWRRENNRTLEQGLERVALEGVGAVEFAEPEGLDDELGDPIENAAALKDRCEQLGLQVAGFCVAAELWRPPVEQRRAVEAIKRHIDVAAQLKAPSLRHDISRGPQASASGRYDLVNDDALFVDALEAVVPAIRDIADYGQAHGVKTTLENHGFFIQASGRVERVLEAVDHPNFSLTLDMGNFLCVNEDPVKAVARLAKHAVLVHVKDFYVKPIEHMPTAPDSGWFATTSGIGLRGAIVGHGQIDIPAQLKILEQAGYDGYLSLEFEGIEHPGLAVRLGLSYLRDRLKEVS